MKRPLPVAQVRHWEGAEALDGIDTLLVHLLADANSAAALESFAAAPNEVGCCTIRHLCNLHNATFGAQEVQSVAQACLKWAQLPVMCPA